MKKAVLLVALASFVVSAAPSFAQTAGAGGSGDGKVKTAVKKVGAGIMWGPKKIGQGLKKVGEGAKKMVGKG